MIGTEAFRTLLIEGIADSAQTLLVEPPAKGAKMWEQTSALAALVHGYRDLVKATSTSNRGYELNDIHPREKVALARAEHLIPILGTLHGPREVLAA